MLLKDKAIVVTGATKGIGRAVALGAAKEGARVVLGGRDRESAESLLSEIAALHAGDAVFCAGDLTSVSNCEALVQTALKRYGRLDGLVNYAGTVQASAVLGDVSEEQFDRIMAVNFKSCFFTTQAAIRAMRERGGSIVFMGSMHAYGGEVDRPAYACSKGATYTFFKHVARNFAQYQIRSNWIAIGWVATPGEEEFRRQLGEEADWADRGKAFIPMGRLQTAEDYVDGTVYLLSDGSNQTTGSELFITGGMKF